MSRYITHQAGGERQERELLAYLEAAYPEYLVCWIGDKAMPWYNQTARIDIELWHKNGKNSSQFVGKTENVRLGNMKKYLMIEAEHKASLSPIFIEAKDRSDQEGDFKYYDTYIRGSIKFEPSLYTKYGTGETPSADYLFSAQQRSKYGGTIFIPEGKINGDLHRATAIAVTEGLNPTTGKYEVVTKDIPQKDASGNIISDQTIDWKATHSGTLPTIDGFNSIISLYPHSQCYISTSYVRSKTDPDKVELACVYNKRLWNKLAIRTGGGKSRIDSYAVPLSFFADIDLKGMRKLADYFGSDHMPKIRLSDVIEKEVPVDAIKYALKKGHKTAGEASEMEDTEEVIAEQNAGLNKPYNRAINPGGKNAAEINNERRLKEQKYIALHQAFTKGKGLTVNPYGAIKKKNYLKKTPVEQYKALLKKLMDKYKRNNTEYTLM
jgi:hypothetical protein